MTDYTPDQIATGDWVRQLADESPLGIRAFYHTPAWVHKRSEILRRDHYACQRCKAEGRGYVRADTVHHLIHLKNDLNLALTDDNLVSVCATCHDRYHEEKHFRGGTTVTQERWD